MSQVFLPARVALRRLFEIALSCAVGFAGLVIAFHFESTVAAIAAGLVAGFAACFLSSWLWPILRDAFERDEWAKFLATLVIPSGLGLGAGLVHAMWVSDLAGIYAISFAAACLAEAALELWLFARQLKK